MSHYLRELITYFKDDKVQMHKIDIFLEVTSLRMSEVGQIVKANWGFKTIGGRYKASKISAFMKKQLKG